MYVMWDPAIPPVGQKTCTPASVNTGTTPYTFIPSTCASIPVPLASVEWEWAACGINAGGAIIGSSWFVECGNAHTYISDEAAYPEWTTCDSSKFGGCKD